jgi:outer membrane protein TolC
LLVVFSLLGMTEFAVGPDFQVPASPTVDRYTQSPLPKETVASLTVGGAEQRFAAGRDIPDQWWSLFQSKALDQLIRMAMEESPSITLAEARLREVRENRNAQFGAFFPAIDAGASAGRQKISGASQGRADTSIDAFSIFSAG